MKNNQLYICLIALFLIIPYGLCRAQIYNSDILPAVTNTVIENTATTEDNLPKTNKKGKKESNTEENQDEKQSIKNKDGSVTTISADGNTRITIRNEGDKRTEIVTVVEKDGTIITTVTTTSANGIVTKTTRVKKP